MAISDWPLSERPREKLLRRGAQSLSDAELLAIFLRTGVAGKSAVDLARELIAEFGSLRALVAADQQHFCRAKGLGQAKFAQLQAVLEMGRRHLNEELQRLDCFTSPAQTMAFLRRHLRDRQREVFALMLLDNQHQLLHYDELFEGTLDAAAVYPREVVKLALQHNAAAVILAHNHPSGIAEPSLADQQITERLKNALALVDIRVLDHLVVGEGRPVSFAERGLL
ncbi:JAB domain-containing protein [Motiliproteus coralliicola]|uniref:JAB domain-containing protein n=1 Tax=Motiliproteus coralliicola TaxID=2283196 RepID=A0A369WAW5_9GAMM|nr:DNA repair protein RadC [Motiliproteus coralliicola]RDE19150.1 JAB domain-containing protein [Motiliproteus coralliicola]